MDSAPRRIRPLPPQLANQIAAGEVVERPASVVKELVENSLDAGADEILIEAEEGGVRLLRVRDNGGGIHRDDLALALSRHATSKVRSARDLLGIASLGFRGEALASIASVARLRLTSRTRESESSWTVTGEADPPAPAPHPVGTTVEMRDLFYNVPARRKFLRAERTEYEHLEEVVRRLALGNFGAGFTLRHNGRGVFQLPAAKEAAARERRLGLLLGRPFLEHAAAIEFEAAGLRLHGWIGAGGYTRSHADVQFVYLNGRAIRDRVVNHALRQAFNDVVPAGRFPAYLLYLEMDPAQVDVNVHPTKHEVRFREARLVHDFLVSALRDALGQAQQWSTPPLTRVAESAVADGQGAYASSRRPAPAPRDPAPRGTAPKGPSTRLIAGRFLLGEGLAGVFLVDALKLVQQEARDALGKAHAASEKIAARPLLIPVTVRVGEAGVGQAEEQGDRLCRFGVDLRPVSAETIRVLGVPDVAATFDAALLATAALHACARQADDAALLDAWAKAVVLPGEKEWPALLARARERAGVAVELDAERLARLVAEGG